jgi:hypothetical protein
MTSYFRKRYHDLYFREAVEQAYSQENRELFYWHVNCIRQDFNCSWEDVYMSAIAMGLTAPRRNDYDRQAPLELD